jgi:hypothetical protein
MADPHVITALVEKYSRTLGRLRDCEREAETLRADLSHLEAAIRLFRADYDFTVILPRRRYTPQASRTLIRRALDVLRDADEPLTSRGVALALTEGEPEELALRKLANNLTGRLRRQQKAGVVRALEGSGAVRWELVR